MTWINETFYVIRYEYGIYWLFLPVSPETNSTFNFNISNETSYIINYKLNYSRIFYNSYLCTFYMKTKDTTTKTNAVACRLFKAQFNTKMLVSKIHITNIYQLMKFTGIKPSLFSPVFNYDNLIFNKRFKIKNSINSF